MILDRRRWAYGAAGALLVALGACGEDGGAKEAAPERRAAPPARAAARLEEVVRPVEDITLEENDDVVNVLIRMSLDGGRGFLVADEQEVQVRQYDRGGRLVRRFARKGDGPKEFQVLHRALRLPGGEILALDMYNKGAVFDSAGSEVVRTFRTPVGPLHSARLLGDTLLLMGGQVTERRLAQPEARLHLWNLKRDSLVRSFFTPTLGGPGRELAANTAGWVSADVRGDTIAATFALSDTVYLFGVDGRRIGAVPLAAPHFRPLATRAPLPDLERGVVAAREWVGTFSMVSDVWWLRDGSFLVQYQDRVGTVPHWRLARMDRAGRPIFEVMDSPYLLAVDRAADELYLTKPGSEVPNVWTRASLVR